MKRGARMSENEAKQLVNRAALAGEHQWSDFEASFREMLGKGLESFDVPGSGELDALQAVVGDLEKQFFALGEPFILSKKI
jgi:BMFP domain-containing protein YqiC